MTARVLTTGDVARAAGVAPVTVIRADDELNPARTPRGSRVYTDLARVDAWLAKRQAKADADHARRLNRGDASR